MATKRERSELGRQLSALRRRVRVRCTVCGKTVTGTTKRRYCTFACRQRAYRERKAATEGTT